MNEQAAKTERMLIWSIKKANDNYERRQKQADNAAEQLAYYVSVYQKAFPERHDELIRNNKSFERALDDASTEPTK